MNLRGVVQRVFGIKKPLPLQHFTKYIDADLGEFTFCRISSSWFIHQHGDAGNILIRGRSEAPTEEQKALIHHFMPLLPSLTEASLVMLRPPYDFPGQHIPTHLILRELRFESTGVVELFFEPEIDIDGYTLWPMATCSHAGSLLSTDWTT